MLLAFMVLLLYLLLLFRGVGVAGVVSVGVVAGVA